MKRPIISLLVAIGLFILGSMSLAPFTPSKKQVAADRTITQRTESERRLAELHVNWFAYLCFAGGAASFAWTVFLVSAGIVCIIRARHHDNAAEPDHWSEQPPRFSARRQAAVRMRRVRPTVPVGGCRSVLALARDLAGESNTHRKPERTR